MCSYGQRSMCADLLNRYISSFITYIYGNHKRGFFLRSFLSITGFVSFFSIILKNMQKYLRKTKKLLDAFFIL